MRFRNRSEGGSLLAEALGPYRAAHPVVVALARGGVPVGLEVASRIGTPLEVIVATRVTPEGRDQPVAVVVEGCGAFVNASAARELGVSDAAVQALAEPELRTVERRGALYRGGRALPDVSGRTVLLVDDGVATGATARAACCTLRKRGAARVVLAAPVVTATVEPELHAMFDDVVAIERPFGPARNVSAWYDDYPRLGDEDVLACLERVRDAGVAEDADDDTPADGDAWDGDWIDADSGDDARF